jgi:hypothetical protein
VADDAGALLVRSGLVSANALEEARARVASAGGTLGEQLVSTGAIADGDLTDFYRSRLLVPQVNPNMLARLTPKIVAAIPSDMAIELRAIPVSLDGENNLTIAMSDPSDRHAVDEIAFFTGAYIVRSVATQMQIAWCLAHYYGHVTALGQRLLYPTESEPPGNAASSATSQQAPRTKAPTRKLDAARHHAVAPAPVTGPVNVARPSAGELSSSPPAPAPPTPRSMPVSEPRTIPTSTIPTSTIPTSTPTEAGATIEDPTPLEIEGGHATPDEKPGDDEGAIRTQGSPDILATSDGAPDHSRARSVSGEIRTPIRRAPSIRPPLPEPDEPDEPKEPKEPNDSDDDDEPVIVIEPGGPDDETTDPRMPLRRRRGVKSDPPELYARAGEVDLKADRDRLIDVDEPRIVIDEDALAPPVFPTGGRDAAVPPITTNGVLDDADTDALIQHRVLDEVSQPILLERPRATPERFRSPPAAAPEPDRADIDPDETTIIVLDARKAPEKKPRAERRTQVGIPPVPTPFRPHRDTETTGIPAMLEHPELDRTIPVDDDATTLEILPAPPARQTTSEQLLAPPSPARSELHPNLLAAPPGPAPSPPAAIQRAVIDEEPDAGDDEPSGVRTSVRTDVELDEAIPGRAAEVVPGDLLRRRANYDPIDDGWGPPGTTIPPPLLGAIPGSDDDDDGPSTIPMPSVDSSPLVVAPPSVPPAGDPGGGALVRALEEATALAINVIRQLERAANRDEVVRVMVTHLAETHHRAGFFVTRQTASRGMTELGLFSMMPKPAVMPFATLRLDRPSTLQDVVGTRLPYRGPMHDDASRTFLIAVLGACPPEILLVPVAVRERVVGVLFGEHRQRHTFDDQLAIAARAAGMALERILKAKRG